MRARIVVMVAALCLLLASPLIARADTTSAPQCSGGYTDPFAMPVSAGGHTVYVDSNDGSLWEETNGAIGLQRTAETCIVDYYNAQGEMYKAVVVSYTPPDTPLPGGLA
ncbi:MAG: hypothetical protein ACYDDF_06020 [Thermoplasmatota archaeon]